MKKVNKSTAAILIITLVALQTLTGCTSKSNPLEQENARLKQELQASSQKLEAANKQLEQINKELESSKQKLSEQEKVYELRNTLDSELHYLLDALVNGNNDYAAEHMTDNIKIENGKLLMKDSGAEFVIPDRLMNLRQRAYMTEGDKYSAIYEIYDAGYDKGEKYDDRIYTLNIAYIQQNDVWKLNNIGIDE